VKNIWLCGIPGAGTYTCSDLFVVSYNTLKTSNFRENRSFVSGNRTSGDIATSPKFSYFTDYLFFCSYKNPNMNTCLSVLRTLIYQIICQDEQLLLFVYEQCIASLGPITIPRCKKILNDLLELCLPDRAGKVFILIDGLDELPEADRAQLIPVLKRIKPKCGTWPYLSPVKICQTFRNFFPMTILEFGSEIKTRMTYANTLSQLQKLLKKILVLKKFQGLEVA